MLKKVTIIISIMFSALNSYCQRGDNMFFDKGNGVPNCLQVGITTIKLIQQNNMEMLLQFYKNKNVVDTKELQKQIEAIEGKYPYSDSILPPAYMGSSENVFYYERNFCSLNKKSLKIVLQIHVDLIKQGDKYYIEEIEFRYGEKIKPRQKEINDLVFKMENTDLPPPPPPPPFR